MTVSLALAHVLTRGLTGFFLWIAGLSLIRLFRPPQTPIAETGTPA